MTLPTADSFKSPSNADEEMYQKILRHAGVLPENSDLLRIKGSEAYDFLNRLSTNDISSMQPGGSIHTVLTTEKGKIVDFVRAFSFKEDLILSTSRGRGGLVSEWLKKFIIMEDLQIDHVTDLLKMISIAGDKNVDQVPERNMRTAQDGSLLSNGTEVSEMSYYSDDLWTIPKITVLGVGSDVDEFTRMLLKSLPLINPLFAEAMRIHQGIGAFGIDFSEEENPLEASLDKFVSFTKGCYIGQEVIARLDTYKKTQKKLYRVRFFDYRDRSNPPIDIVREGKVVGKVTSVSWSYDDHCYVGIGSIKMGISLDELYLSSGATISVEMTPGTKRY